MLVVLTLVGTRPEAIKMAPVLKELGKHRDQIRSIVCVTGQHRQMLEQALEIFQIHPDYDLAVMEPDQMLSRLTTKLLTSLNPVVEETHPNWILAQGDTTTVLVAALVSYYQRVLFGHVEAGLRTGDKFRPYPEEMNRRIADQLADALFAPTEQNRQALLREGIADNKIAVTGNTVVDALQFTAERPFDWSTGPLASLPEQKQIVLVTAHRRESFGQPLREICLAVKELSISLNSEGVHFVYPVHLNPNVRKAAEGILSGLPNVSLIEPLDYSSMIHLMKRSKLILTDSGGIQEEAPSLGVPVLVMRDATERPEGVEMRVARLVGTNRSRIVEEVTRLLRDPAAYAAMVTRENPYGDGNASRRIVSFLLQYSEGAVKTDQAREE